MTQRLNLASLMLLFWSLILSPPLFADPSAPNGDAASLIPPSLSVALTPDKLSEIDIKDAKAALTVWIDLIAKVNGSSLKVDLLYCDNLAALEKEAKGNKIDWVFLFPQEFGQINNRIPFEPIALSLPMGGEHKRFAVLVHKDSGINKVGELTKRDALIEEGLNASLLSLWLETLLMKEGFLSPAAFFSKFKNVKKSSQALLPVFFRQSNACVVSRGAFETMKELNPQVGQDLIPIAQSPGYPQGILCMRKGWAEKYEAFVEQIFSVHNQSQGKQIFTLMKINKFIPYKPAYLETTKALMQEHQALKLKLAKKD